MKQTISSLLIIAIYTSLIAPLAQTANAQTLMQTRDTQQKDIQQGLKFSLSEGSDQGGATEQRPPANTSQLDDSATSQLLGRMPDLKTEDTDKKDFAKRAGSLPAPKTGNRIPVKFPADEQRDPNSTSNDRSLQVLRYSPEGEVSLAPDLSVTFSEPMVAVTSQQEASGTVPVRMEPAAEGKWRWLGTKTLMFDTDKRFPMATVFKLTVPAGTKSATGQTLEKDVSWTFTTPPPKIEQHFPGNGSTNTRDEIIFLRFDQKIDQQAMLESITVTGGGKRLPTRLATESEIDGSRIKYYKDQSQPGRWIAIKALNSEGGTENALPADSSITVTVNKGAPSAEGPLTTKDAQSFGFRTYGAFKFVEARCGYSGNTECSPFEMWYVRFTNGIDGSSFEQSKVKVEPAVEGLNIYPSGNAIYFQGVKKGRTTYTITIDGSLKDVYGQSLTGGASAKIKVGSAPPNLYAQGGFMTVLDPAGKKPYFSIFTINHKEVRMKVYKVGPEDWHEYQQHVRYLDYDDGTKAPMPGTLLRNETVGIESVADELTETRIDLSRYLSNGYGNLVLFIEPTVRKDKYDRSRVVTWLQSTSIGLDAFVDSDELVGFATELGTGKPMAGVDLRIYPNGGTVSSRGASDADESYAAWLWNWITSWGSASPGEISSYGPSGEVVEIDPVEKAQTNTTPANGVLRLPLPAKAAGEPNLLIAKKGNDVAFLPENSDYFWRDTGSWHVNPQNDYLRWFVFDDRKMYKPQEEVSVKGYIRKVTGGELGDVQGLGDAASGITYSVKDPRNNEIAKGTANLNAFGAFDLKFKLPDNANLGYARVEFSTQSRLSGGSYNHQFQIQEFRRPEFEVTSKVVTEAPHFVGGHANVEVEAKYYSGGGLAQADVNWTVRANPTNYTPPNRGDFIFGHWTPWWIGGRGEYYGGGTTQSYQGKTDAAGKHNLRIDFESVKPPRPYQITAFSSVQDVNRQTWSSTANLLVHPADLYVGIRSQRNFVQKGEDIKIESIVSDLDGNLVAGRKVEIKALLRSWVFDKGKWEEKVVDEQFCTVTSAAEAQMCRFPAKQGGVYTITALVMDDRERFNESEMTVWVAGGKTPPNRNVEQESVEIIPSGKEFKPAETAEILVIAPFTPAEGILTLRREGVVKAERFTMTDSSVTLKIPIEEAYLPNIYAQVDIVGAAERTNDDGEVNKDLAKRPAFASGSINLPVSIASRELTVEAKPKDTTLVPGGETTVDVAVRDFQGEPVANSEVALVVVDESVLALSAYNLANPVSVFYSQRSAGVSDFHSRADVLLSNPKDVSPPPPPPSPAGEVSLLELQPGVAAKAARADTKFQMDGASVEDFRTGQLGDSEPPITLRKNFDALAVFAPSVRTDSYGNATVKVKLPDNLTRYRVMAVSVDNAKRFGKTESAITARQPLMIRPSAPRFMNFGDKIELPVVVQNQTDKDMTVNVAVRAANATLTAGGGRRVLVRANDREEVRFPVSADMAGTARFQIAGSSGDYSDAAEISLPVWTPATTEAFATYGTTDKDEPIIQPIQAPGDVYSQFGGLEVTTSSTQLQELTDAFIYLYRYRFECTEQVASRMISIAALRDVLKAFKAEEMPSDADIRARFAADMKILQSRQNSDGYFGLWRRDGERYKYPFVTAHTAHALILAKAKGYEVPQEMLDRVKPYLKDIEKHYPSYYPPTVRWTISSYALYVRNLMGDNDSGKAKKLLVEATIEKMPFEALGWLMPVLIDGKNSDEEVLAIKRFLLNRTSETAATAQFNTDYGDDAWLIMHSNRRADGVLLEAMLKAEAAEKGTGTGQSAGDLIPKLVRGLLDHRKKGRWSNTQENVFILLGLDKYFQAYEKVTPDFVTRVWLGNAYAGEQVFKGRSVDFNQLEIPMSYLIEQGGAANLILDKNGPGRLYYRIGMKYAPKDLRLKPADYGFTVLRTYEAVDKPEDVTQGADGEWIIKAGARVRVKLTMVAQARRYHVALVDPLPAGLEILNPDLAVTEFVPEDQNGNTPVIEYGSRSYGGGYYYWRSRWFEHQNFRDERAEAFASLVWGGVYNYTYVARATTPGVFVVPPAKAEEMYHPETFGRTGTDIVHVK